MPSQQPAPTPVPWPRDGEPPTNRTPPLEQRPAPDPVPWPYDSKPPPPTNRTPEIVKPPVCDKPSSARFYWKREKLQHLFQRGRPSNNLKEVGLTIHCFDETEGWPNIFEPCASGWCSKFHFNIWWSASIINSLQRSTFGGAGIILSPTRTKVLCSSWTDAATMYGGCKWKQKNALMQPNELKDMLERSINGGDGYNEVLIDSKAYMRNLPDSVAAVAYKLHGVDNLGDRIKATKAYVSLLDTYKLTECDIPLLRANWGPQDPNPVPLFTDMSATARQFLKDNPYAKYRKSWREHHPYLAKHPQLVHGWLTQRSHANASTSEGDDLGASAPAALADAAGSPAVPPP